MAACNVLHFWISMNVRKIIGSGYVASIKKDAALPFTRTLQKQLTKLVLMSSEEKKTGNSLWIWQWWGVVTVVTLQTKRNKQRNKQSFFSVCQSKTLQVVKFYWYQSHYWFCLHVCFLIDSIRPVVIITVSTYCAMNGLELANIAAVYMLVCLYKSPTFFLSASLFSTLPRECVSGSFTHTQAARCTSATDLISNNSAQQQ